MRQKWDYLRLVTDDYGKRVRYSNDEELANWKDGPSVSEYLRQVGNEGWELVAVTMKSNSQTDRDHELFFKRER
jgi:hypothetical protein